VRQVVGIVPAAGLAERLQPLAGSKEVQLVRGQPVLAYVVERMRRAPCTELRVVTRPEKRDVVALARRLGARVVEGRPETVAASILLALDGLAGDDVALVGFPDTLWEPVDGYARLLERLRPPAEVVLGLFEFAEPERSDVVEPGPAGVVERVRSRPTDPSSNLVWGCLAARVGALADLPPGDEPGRHLDWLARAGRVAAVRLEGELVDIGTPASLSRYADVEPVR
jgi:NDP-sugar pyrophosphorylase family protein